MKKIFLIFAFFMFFLGCSEKGINIYLNESVSVKNNFIKVFDQRSNKNFLGYIYENGVAVADITFSSNLEKLILSKLKKLKKRLTIYILKFNINYNKSDLVNENCKGRLILKVVYNQNIVKIIKIEESKWIAPFYYSRKIENFAKKMIDDAIYQMKSL